MFATPVFVRHVNCLRINEALQRSVRLRGVRQQGDGFIHVLIAISGAYAKKSAAPEIVLQAPAARLFCCMSCGYT